MKDTDEMQILNQKHRLEYIASYEGEDNTGPCIRVIHLSCDVRKSVVGSAAEVDRLNLSLYATQLACMSMSFVAGLPEFPSNAWSEDRECKAPGASIPL